MKLYDYLAENRKVGTIIDYDVPAAYPTVSNEVTFTGAPLGKYAIAYNFEVFFNGIKDKPIEFITMINGTDGEQFAEMAPDRSGDNYKSRLYGRDYTWGGGDLTVGIKFRDVESKGFIIVHSDVSITRLG